MLVAGSSEAADAFARAENAVVLYGREGLDFAGSSALAQACANLLITTGHTGRANNGLIAVWPRANTMGAWDMGVPAREGADRPFDGATASWIVAADPVGDGRLTAGALRASGFVVVQELFLSETAQAADVVLPAASWAEREGTFTSGERRVQRFYPAIPARGKPDYEIAVELGRRLGVTLPRHASLLFLEIAASVPAYAGLSYQKLAEVAQKIQQIVRPHVLIAQQNRAVMAYPSVDNCLNSASVNATSAARMFSSKWSTLDVPGIGTMTGERRSSQASASWAGVAPCARAAASSGPPGRASCPVAIGYQGMNAMSLASQYSSTGSAERRVRL